MASQDDKEKVGRIDENTLSLQNQLKLRAQINKAEKESLNIQQKLNTLTQQQAREAASYSSVSTKINNLEKDILTRKQNSANLTGRALAVEQRAIARREKALKTQQAIEKSLLQTVGGRIKAEQIANDKRRDALEAEKELIKDINKQQTVKQKFLDLFRSKEERQRRIDQARLKAGGGTNEGPRAAGGEEGALAAAGPYGAIAALVVAKVKALAAPFQALGKAVKDGLTAPLSEAAGLIDGGGYGTGGGKASGKGVTSMMDGITNVITGFTDLIPVVGGFISMAIKGFNTLLQAILGINQAQVNFARNQGISLKAAQGIRAQFQQISLSSNNIVVNQTRLLEQQVELSEALGVTNIMSRSILENDVKLKDIAGFELESRQKIAELSIITGQNAEKLTKNLMGQVGYVKKVTGLSLNFRNVLGELSKLSGVLGLQFAKYPNKIADTLLKVKVLGFDLKQLRDQASGFLDFENSISKEFEAQVLTGKEMNLTKAREAALNNDMVTLSAEIAKNVGNSTDFLKLNRIQQDAVAEAVNMTADGLADVLRKQEMYNKLGANNQKDAMANFELLNKTKEGKAELIAKLGEENYAAYNQVSIAEKLAAVMEKIKQTFIDFIEKSKIFEFLTDEKRVNNFIRSILSNLAGAVDTVGDIFAGIMEAIASLPFTDTDKWQGYAASIRGGASTFSGGIRAASGGIGLADGGVVTETGMAKVDKGEVYLGANSISVLKDQLDAQRENNKLLTMLLNQKQSIKVDGREIAIANAENATTVYNGQFS